MSPLAETLIALVESVQSPPGFGLTVTEASIAIPLEINVVVEKGRLAFYGAPPHSRWVAGFLPETHMTRIEVRLLEEAEGGG